jgi:hypothetical protein
MQKIGHNGPHHNRLIPAIIISSNRARDQSAIGVIFTTTKGREEEAAVLDEKGAALGENVGYLHMYNNNIYYVFQRLAAVTNPLAEAASSRLEEELARDDIATLMVAWRWYGTGTCLF